MPVRQVQAHEAPRRGLRKVRHRSDADQGAPRAHGPHRPGLAGRAHLVPQVAAFAHRPDARHDPARHRAHSLFRSLRRHRSGPDSAQPRPVAQRRAVPAGGRGARRRVRRAHGRRSRLRTAQDHRSQRGTHSPARGNRCDQFRDQAQAPVQAHQAGRGVQRFRQPSGIHGHDRAAGAAAGSASAGAAGRRPLCDVGSERPVPPRHQPQQSPAPPARTQRAGHHRTQREAHAAGSGRCADGQRPPRPRHHRHEQAPAEIAWPT